MKKLTIATLAILLMSTIALDCGCSTTDSQRAIDRNGGTESPTLEYIATIQITCQCPVHTQSCGKVIVQGIEQETCLPYYKEVPVKQGEYLNVQYVTTNTNQHKIYVRANGKEYGRVNSGTVSLTEKIP